MCSVQALREFINGRLTAAAGEIFTVFEQTIVQYEEEIDRQRRLLDISWKPQRKFHTAENPQQHVWKKEHLSNQGRNSIVEQEAPELLQIKEEEEERCTSQEGAQLVLKQETDTFMVTVTEGESDHSDAEPDSEQLLSPDSVREFINGQLTAAAGKIFTMFEQTIVRYKVEIDRHRRLLDNTLNTTQKLHRADNPQQHVCKQERNSSLQEPESPQIKEEQEDLCTSQERGLPVLKQENDNFMETPVGEESDHMSENARETDTGKKSLKCGICGKEFKFISQLTKHHRIHTGEKPYSCQVCGKRFIQKQHLKTHLKIHTGEKPYSCETCGKSFKHGNSLLIHMRTHTGEKPYLCNTCGKRFTDSSTMKKHTIIHKGDKPFPCETCGESFRTNFSFSVHMRTHTGEKPYTCESCGKCFSQEGNLLVHMRTHTGEKPFSCELCDKSFSQQGTLMRHMRIHTGEKPYLCNFCDKRFTNASALKRHTRVHTGEKPYSCETCNKSFSEQSNLLVHMRTHTGEMSQS